MKYIDLFAGTGAFSYVLEKKGYECVFANDMEVSSQKIYQENNDPANFVLGNLNDVEVENIPKHDLLCAGFPCQPFSIAGKQEGFKDPRSNVFWKIVDIINYHKPSILLLENVKNLTSHDEGRTFQIIISSLKEKGYHIKYEVLDTSKFTPVPQHRERIYIVAFREKTMFDKFEFNFEPIENSPISKYLEDKIHDKYYYTEKLKVFPIIQTSVTKPVYETNTVYQYRRYYVRENKSNQCPTLTANMGGGGHNVPIILDKKGIRKLIPRECFHLQGFPRDYKLPKLSDSSLYKLAGNAVSIPIIELIIDRIDPLINGV
jgi:DNA (cytosine-5)-methyltransferase 1